jgi:hypothetical protein
VEHRDLFTEVSTRLEATTSNFFSSMDGSVNYGLALLRLSVFNFCLEH